MTLSGAFTPSTNDSLSRGTPPDLPAFGVPGRSPPIPNTTRALYAVNWPRLASLSLRSESLSL